MLFNSNTSRWYMLESPSIECKMVEEYVHYKTQYFK